MIALALLKEIERYFLLVSVVFIPLTNFLRHFNKALF